MMGLLKCMKSSAKQKRYSQTTPPIFKRSKSELLRVASSRVLNSFDATNDSVSASQRVNDDAERVDPLAANARTTDQCFLRKDISLTVTPSDEIPEGKVINISAIKSQSNSIVTRRSLEISDLVDQMSYEEDIVDESPVGDICDQSYDEITLEDDIFEPESHRSSTKSKKKRTVGKKFVLDGFDQIMTTIHIDDYTDKEIRNCWWESDDYEKMMANADKTVAKLEAMEFSSGLKMKKNGSLAPANDLKADIRGLEGWTQKGSLAVLDLRERAIDAVWNEQIRQFRTGVIDNERISAVYHRVASQAQATAEARASIDRIQAEAIYSESNMSRLVLLQKSKSIATRARRNSVLKKATNTLWKSFSRSADIGETLDDRPLMFKQPSRSSHFFLESADASATFDLRNELEGSLAMKKRGIGEKQGRPKLMVRTASWESGLSAGKF